MFLRYLLLMVLVLLSVMRVDAGVRSEVVGGDFSDLIQDLDFDSSAGNPDYPDAPRVQDMQLGQVYNYSSADKNINVSAFVVESTLGQNSGDGTLGGVCRTRGVVRILTSCDKIKLSEAVGRLEVDNSVAFPIDENVCNSWDLDKVRVLVSEYEKGVSFTDNKNKKRTFYYALVMTGCSVREYHPFKQKQKDLTEDDKLEIAKTSAHEHRHFEDFTTSLVCCVSPIYGYVENSDNIADEEVRKQLINLFRQLEETYAQIIIIAEARAVAEEVNVLVNDLNERNIPEYLDNNYITVGELCKRDKYSKMSVDGTVLAAGTRVLEESKTVPGLYVRDGKDTVRVSYSKYSYITSQDNPSKDNPSKDNPSKDNPSKDNLSKDNLSKDNLSKDNPRKKVLKHNPFSFEEMIEGKESISYSEMARQSVMARTDVRIRISAFDKDATVHSDAEWAALGYTPGDGILLLCSYKEAYNRYYGESNSNLKPDSAKAFNDCATTYRSLLAQIMTLYHKHVYYEKQLVGNSVKENSSKLVPTWQSSFNTADIKTASQWLSVFVLKLQDIKSNETAEVSCNDLERLCDCWYDVITRQRQEYIRAVLSGKDIDQSASKDDRNNVLTLYQELIRVYKNRCFDHKRFEELLSKMPFLAHNMPIERELICAALRKTYNIGTYEGVAEFYQDLLEATIEECNPGSKKK